MGHRARYLGGRVAPRDSQGGAGKEHVGEVLGGDEGNVVQAVDLGVDVVDRDDRDLNAKDVGDLAGEGALETRGGGDGDADQADLAGVREESRYGGARYLQVASDCLHRLPLQVVHRSRLVGLFVTYCHVF